MDYSLHTQSQWFRKFFADGDFRKNAFDRLSSGPPTQIQKIIMKDYNLIINGANRWPRLSESDLRCFDMVSKNQEIVILNHNEKETQVVNYMYILFLSLQYMKSEVEKFFAIECYNSIRHYLNDKSITKETLQEALLKNIQIVTIDLKSDFLASYINFLGERYLLDMFELNKKHFQFYFQTVYPSHIIICHKKRLAALFDTFPDITKKISDPTTKLLNQTILENDGFLEMYQFMVSGNKETKPLRFQRYMHLLQQTVEKKETPGKNEDDGDITINTKDERAELFDQLIQEISAKVTTKLDENYIQKIESFCFGHVALLVFLKERGMENVLIDEYPLNLPEHIVVINKEYNVILYDINKMEMCAQLFSEEIDMPIPKFVENLFPLKATLKNYSKYNTIKQLLIDPNFNLAGIKPTSLQNKCVQFVSFFNF